MEEKHYFDYAATAPVLPEAISAAVTAMEAFGNPSARYGLGQQAKTTLETHRQTIATALNCAPSELTFTSGGTEGDNWAIRGAVALQKRRGNHIITTAIEHAAVLEPLAQLKKEGYDVTYLKPDTAGHISPDAVKNALRPDTILVSMMLVNNELGAILPVKETANAIKEAGSHALLHCDAVQSFLKVPCNPKDLGVDLMTLSGHKIGAPKGIGALYIRNGINLPPLLLGGGQENGLRSGTEPTPQIAAFAAAVQAWQPSWTTEIGARKTQFLAELQETIKDAVVLTEGDAPHVCAVSLPGYPSEMLVRELDDRGYCLSSGSACHRGKPSHVFATLNKEKRTMMGALRVSFGHQTTKEEVSGLVSALSAITKERFAMR